MLVIQCHTESEVSFILVSLAFFTSSGELNENIPVIFLLASMLAVAAAAPALTQPVQPLMIS